MDNQQADPSVVAGHTAVDDLAWWRTIPPHRSGTSSISRRLTTTIAARLERMEFGNDRPGFDQALLAARARDPEGMLVLADMVPQIVDLWYCVQACMPGTDPLDGDDGRADLIRDFRGSLLWCSIVMGSKNGVVALATMVLALDYTADLELSVQRDLVRKIMRMHIVDPARRSDAHERVSKKERQLRAEKRPAVTTNAFLETIEGLDAGDDVPPPAKPTLSTRPTANPKLCVIVSGTLPEGSAMRKYATLASPLDLQVAAPADFVSGMLLAEFPWAAEVVDRIHTDLVLAERMGSRALKIQPFILHGDAGSGRSRFVQRLAKILGVPSATMSASGSVDNRALAGTAKGWSTASPCMPVELMTSSRIANPMLIIEEIDKAGGSEANGSMAQTLLTMIERTTSRAYLDECLSCTVDLSRVSWAMTANDPSRIPALLRHRVRMLRMPRPRAQDFYVLLDGVRSDMAGELGVDYLSLPKIDEKVIDAMESGFRRGQLSARSLATLVRRSIEMTAKMEHEMEQEARAGYVHQPPS